ncbi:Uncharacterized protein FWK35_00000988 [Aphis craccivora]|uniref:Uncharacterized protein n=1 Tax=Aphis craccivora TaxID=307492 RepID=A0A6G0ZJL2_APHCR|nr:Uncharacterized protein FWK35_00000988 [Aphis craccivora]
MSRVSIIGVFLFTVSLCTADICGFERHTLSRSRQYCLSSKGSERVRIVFPLNTRVLDKFFEECCPGAVIPILGIAEMKVIR